MVVRRIRVAWVGACAGVAFATSAASAKVSINLDYTYDTNGFFTTHPEAKAALTLASQTLSDRFRDNLTAISPGGSNHWTAEPFDPNDVNSTLSVSDLFVPANTITVFAGASVLGGSTLGIGGPGGYSASGFQNWFDTLQARGQAAALESPATDNAPWGGTITFDTTTNWNFALGTGPTNKSQSDFLSVATHELAHLLGFGTAESWQNRVSGGVFTGPASGSVDVSPDGGHLAQSTKGSVGTGTQEAVMTPSITQGTRKRFTSIDWAGMSDLGWQLARFGDANADGTVDFNDLVALAQHYNISDGQRRWAEGDFDFDGNVDFNDLVKLAQNYNTSEAAVPAAALAQFGSSFASDWAAAEALAATSTPEPAAWCMAGVAVIGAAVRRRRRA